MQFSINTNNIVRKSIPAASQVPPKSIPTIQDIKGLAHQLKSIPLDFFYGSPIPSKQFSMKCCDILDLAEQLQRDGHAQAVTEIIDELVEVAIELEYKNNIELTKEIYIRINQYSFDHPEADVRWKIIIGSVDNLDAQNEIQKAAAEKRSRPMAAYDYAHFLQGINKCLPASASNMAMLNTFKLSGLADKGFNEFQIAYYLCKSASEGYEPARKESQEFNLLLKQAEEEPIQHTVNFSKMSGLTDPTISISGSKKAFESGDIQELMKYGDAYSNKDPLLGAKVKKEGCLPFYKKAAELGSDTAMLKLASYFLQKAKSINLNTQKNQNEANRFFLMAANAGNVIAQLHCIKMASKGDKEKFSLCEKVFSGKIAELSEKEIVQATLFLKRINENNKGYGFAALALARLYVKQVGHYSTGTAVELAKECYLIAINHGVPGAKEELEKIPGL